jgi:hypothetical protein
MAWVLSVGALGAFSLYCAFFLRAFRSLGADQQRTLMKEARPHWFFYVLLPALMAVLLLASPVAVRVGAAISAVGLGIWGRVTHQRKLEQLGFDIAFRKRLALSFLFAWLGLALSLAFLLLFAPWRR